MLTKVLLFIAAMLGLAFGQMTPTENYSHSATLRSGNIKVYWKFDEVYITFEVMGETTGWLGIGFSPNGAMTGADIIVGWVKNGNVTITDRYGTGNAFPPLDPEQNINILGGAESNGWTMFKFSRQLAACEADYDREITQATQRLIFAYGGEDPTSDDITAANYHGLNNRGVESMYFLQSPNSPSSLPVNETYETFDIVNDNFEIPAVRTYYNCRIVKLPELTSKHHIVKFEPIIQEGNELNVHHMLIYPCGNAVENVTEIGLHAKCKSPNMKHFQECSNTVAVWAIGGTATIYPSEAGYSIGDTDDSMYYMIEMHYDNPEEKSGIIDSSGMRFTYTSNTREYDVGVVAVGSAGIWRAHLIPPRTPDFLTVAHCTSKCVEEIMTDGGVDNITMFNVLLHSHYAGRQLKLRHLRNGIELPFVASDSSYDFNYQEYRVLDPYVILEKSDELQMECVYSTEDRDYVTQGGEGTFDEMCFSFISYFPKLKWGQCSSFVHPDTTYTYLGLDPKKLELIDGENPDYYSSYNITSPPSFAGMTLFEYFNGYNWTTETVKEYETFYNEAQHLQLCVPGDQRLVKIYPIELINITSPYVESKKMCKVDSTTSPSDVTSSPSPGSTSPVATTTSGGEYPIVLINITSPYVESKKMGKIDSTTYPSDVTSSPSPGSTSPVATTTSGGETQRRSAVVLIITPMWFMFFK